MRTHYVVDVLVQKAMRIVDDHVVFDLPLEEPDLFEPEEAVAWVEKHFGPQYDPARILIAEALASYYQRWLLTRAGKVRSARKKSSSLANLAKANAAKTKLPPVT